MPGQTTPTSPTRPPPTTFNGGPGNCPAKPDVLPDLWDAVGRPSMEGRAIARPNLLAAACSSTAEPPSMEGRAIARPNCSEHGREIPDESPSMEGRAIARPNRRLGRQPAQLRDVPSMEGRAIARPNLEDFRRTIRVVDRLQWRAGQLPGQTRRPGHSVRRLSAPFTGGPGNCPAKRGCCGPTPARTSSAFNGGPGNCPAKPVAVARLTRPPSPFNGGPGNCPAKHSHSSSHERDTASFNGGPGNCPAKRSDPAEWCAWQGLASMEGRAIARPNATIARGIYDGAVTASMEGRAIARPNVAERRYGER